MVWFRVDDRFHASEPVKKIPAEHRLAAVGLWTMAGAWSSQFLKDGDVPAHIVEDLNAIDLANMLVKCGLWKKRRGGYVFRDWDAWQPTRAVIEKKRDDQNARVAAYRNRKAENTQSTGEGNAYHESVTKTSNAPVSASRPDPTRPDPTRVKGLERSGGVGTTGPYCTRHPGGTDDACGPCRTARIVFESTQAEAKASSTVKAVTATPRRYVLGDGHEHRVSPGGDRCELCEERIT